MGDQMNIITIPSGANLQLPDDSLLNFYEGIENRVFWVTDEISVFSLNLIHYIMKWNKEDENLPIKERKPIKLLFFSPGGDLDVNYALIDAIQLSRTPIIGINLGQCASAAAYIFLSCPTRLMMPHSYFLFHQGSSTISGSYREICAYMEDYHSQVEELTNFMLTRTKYTQEEIVENIVDEWYVRVDEAIEKGVADGTVRDISLLL